MNKLFLVGRVGGDAEMRFTPSGTAVASFSVASNAKRGDKETTTWFRVTCWGKLAEIASQYVTKGATIAVDARFDGEPRVWQDKSGTHRASLEVTADGFRLFGGTRGDNAPSNAELEDVESIPF